MRHLVCLSETCDNVSIMTTSGTDHSISPFDRRLVRFHRERAATDFERYDFLFREIAARICDRLIDVARRFPLALDLGCHGGELAEATRTSGKVERLVSTDLSLAMARRAARQEGAAVAAADEEALPFASASFDLVLSNLSLHWVNDLPGTLLQVRGVLKPDGLFLGAMLGGETLREMRKAFLEAESEIEGGASPRVSPFADVRDGGALLQRAGFALPVVDRDEITVTYPNALALMRELRGMGETNALRTQRHGLTRRETLLRAAAIYEKHFGQPDGRVPACFQVIYLTGWAPHASQQKPLRPGSATARMAQALGTEERTASDIAPLPKKRMT